MSIAFKRNRPYILLFAGIILILAYFGTSRIISFNIGNKGEITATTNDIENTIDLFDTNKMHVLKLVMTSGDYQSMLDTYSETKEKDYYKIDVVIDGILVEDVGVRLKGNSSLMQAAGNGGPGGNRQEDIQFPGGITGMNFTGVQNFMNQRIGGYGGGSGDENIDYMPFLIKFDKYIEGQTYQGRSMIALRKGGFSDTTLLAEPAAYSVYKSMGQPAPTTSYGQVQVDGKTPYLYVISEVVDDEIYLARHFTGDDGILFKVDSFSSFTYLGEDPTLYMDIFDQETNVNNDDMAQLIDMLDFVTNVSEKEFEAHLDEYIDVDSVLHILAIDTFMSNNDSFGGAGNNYYLYYYKAEKKFYMLTWDQNLAFGGMGGGMGGTGGMQFPGGGGLPPGVTSGDMQKFMERMGSGERMMPPGMDENGERQNNMGGGMGGGENTLKDRLLANETFKKQYDEIYESIKEKVYEGNILTNFLDQWTSVFLEWNEDHELLDEDTYIKSVENLKSFLEQRKTTTSNEISNLKFGGRG